MSKTSSPTAKPQSNPQADLNSRYGAIGIPAVVAALQFRREVKNPAYAPATPQADEERFADMAA